MMIMAANTSGIIGSQLFQQDDGPKYHTGWTVIVALIATGFLLSIAANWQYWWLNRRLDRKGIEAESEEDEGREVREKWRYWL